MMVLKEFQWEILCSDDDSVCIDIYGFSMEVSCSLIIIHTKV